MSDDLKIDSKLSKEPGLSSEEILFYSEKLIPLWESYLRVIGLGLISSAFTVAYLGSFITSSDTIAPDVAWYIKRALLAASIAGASFMIARWSAQVIMEREVYADHKKARIYFEITGTSPPHAISYGTKIRIVQYINEFAKWSGIISMCFSWVLVVQAMFAQIESMAIVN